MKLVGGNLLTAPTPSASQDAYAPALGYRERPGQHWQQRHSSEEPAGLGEDTGPGSGGQRAGVMEHPPLEGLPQPRPGGAGRFEVPPLHGHAPGGGSGGGAGSGAPTRHDFSAEEIAAAQQDGMDLSLLPGVQMAAAQMRALMDNTARVARAEQASGYSLLSSADWDIAQDPSAARLMTPENLAAVRKWAAILSSAGEGTGWPARAAMSEQQQQQSQQQQQVAGLTRPAAAAQLHLWQPAQHREVLQIPEHSGWRPRRRMSEAMTDTDDALGRFAAAATQGRGPLYGYPGEPEFGSGGGNMWQASQAAAAAMQEIEARKRARYSPSATFAEQGPGQGHRSDGPPQMGPPQGLPHEQHFGLFEADRMHSGRAAEFLQVAAERARNEGFAQQPPSPGGLSLAALHAAAATEQHQQRQQHGAGGSGQMDSRLDRIDSMPLLPSAVHRQGPFERRDLAASLSAEPLLTSLNAPWAAAAARGMGRATAAGHDGASRDGASPAMSPSGAPTSSVRVAVTSSGSPCHRACTHMTIRTVLTAWKHIPDIWIDDAFVSWQTSQRLC